MTDMRREFMARVVEAASGTAYTVTQTAQGFDVALDITREDLRPMLRSSRLRRCVNHRVSVGSGTYTILDETRRLQWVDGMPEFPPSSLWASGRTYRYHWSKTYYFPWSDRPGEEEEYRFNSEDGRRLITRSGAALGLRQERPARVTVAMIVGVVMAAFTVGVLVWLLFFL